MMSSRDGFGPSLKAQRERRGLTLESIARSTKIKGSLLAALERNDVSQWPSGIFRRAFLRSYAKALGVSPEPLLEDFEHYFSEDGAPVPRSWEGAEAGPPPRLTFADDREGGWLLTRDVWQAGAETGLVLLLAWGVSYLAGTGFWTTSGLVALVYYPVVLALTGRTVQWRELHLPPRKGREQLDGRAGSTSGLGQAALGFSDDQDRVTDDPELPGDDFRHPDEAVH